MIKKKLLALSMVATSIVTTCIGGISAFAATDPAASNVQVQYKTTTTVAGTDYAVAIPQSIEFTANNRQIPVNLTLENPNGTPYTGAEVTVGGSVVSKNGYKLNLKDNSDPVAYTLTYGGNAMQANTTSQTIGDLTKTNSTLQGNAELPQTSQAAKNGNHTDTLTYTFTKK